MCRPEKKLQMGKNTKFWACVQFGFFDDMGLVVWVLSTFKSLGSCLFQVLKT